MRQIKFRGLRVDNNEWVYGYYWFDNQNKKHKITSDLSDDNFRCYEVNAESVGQFTGLKDRNGKDIYEGDILQYHQHDKFIVSCDNTFLGFSINGSATGALIIGTIHDGKEVKS